MKIILSHEEVSSAIQQYVDNTFGSDFIVSLDNEYKIEATMEPG